MYVGSPNVDATSCAHVAPQACLIPLVPRQRQLRVSELRRSISIRVALVLCANAVICAVCTLTNKRTSFCPSPYSLFRNYSKTHLLLSSQVPRTLPLSPLFVRNILSTLGFSAHPGNVCPFGYGALVTNSFHRKGTSSCYETLADVLLLSGNVSSTKCWVSRTGREVSFQDRSDYVQAPATVAPVVATCARVSTLSRLIKVCLRLWNHKNTKKSIFDVPLFSTSSRDSSCVSFGCDTRCRAGGTSSSSNKKFFMFRSHRSYTTKERQFLISSSGFALFLEHSFISLRQQPCSPEQHTYAMPFERYKSNVESNLRSRAQRTDYDQFADACSSASCLPVYGLCQDVCFSSKALCINVQKPQLGKMSIIDSDKRREEAKECLPLDSLTTRFPVRQRKPVVFVLGPTGVGKTKLAVQLCLQLRKHFGQNAEIINADSMQVYKDCEIGTAKATAEEQRLVPHHLLDICDVTAERFSVVQFLKLAIETIEKLHADGRLPVVVGGTQLYMHHLLWESALDAFVLQAAAEESATAKATKNCQECDSVFSSSSPSITLGAARLYPLEKLQQLPTEGLYNELCTLDPQRAAELHPHDRRRILRSLETYATTGELHSALMKKHRDIVAKKGLRYSTCILWLDCRNEEIHLRRLRDRVQQMLEKGILKECEFLLDKLGLEQQENKEPKLMEEFCSTTEEKAAANEEMRSNGDSNSEEEAATQGSSRQPLIMQSIGYKEFLPFVRHARRTTAAATPDWTETKTSMIYTLRGMDVFNVKEPAAAFTGTGEDVTATFSKVAASPGVAVEISPVAAKKPIPLAVGVTSSPIAGKSSPVAGVMAPLETEGINVSSEACAEAANVVKTTATSRREKKSVASELTLSEGNCVCGCPFGTPCPPTLETAAAALVLHSRQYAKKQRRWIVNKFLLRQQRLPVYLLDVSEAGGAPEWETLVEQPALQIVQDFLAGIPFKEDHPYAAARHLTPVEKAKRLFYRQQQQQAQHAIAATTKVLESPTEEEKKQTCEVNPKDVVEVNIDPWVDGGLNQPRDCPVCHRTCRGHSDWRAHLRSKHHKARLQQMSQSSLSFCSLSLLPKKSFSSLAASAFPAPSIAHFTHTT